MKNLVFILLLVSFGANAQNKTVILKVPTADTTTILAPYLRSTGFGLLKSGQTVSADSSLLSTKLWRQKGIDSVQANVNLKVNISDTATMLSPYARNYNVVHITGTETITGAKTFNASPALGANVVNDSTINISQVMASSDFWKIYGTGTTADQGELVFKVGDNGAPYSPLGERFRFSYDNSGGGSGAKDALIIDYDSSYFTTRVVANSFRVYGSSDSYFLLGGGGTVATSSFASSSAISGTTNYIPKFTSSSAIGNSLIYDNGTSVLIGTISTNGQKLQVDGSASLSGQINVNYNYSTFGLSTTPGYPVTIQTNQVEQSIKFIGKNDNNNVQFFNSAETIFQAVVGTIGTDFYIGTGTSGTPRLTIKSTGVISTSSRLNINGATDDGSTALNVNGTGRFSGLITSTVGNNSSIIYNASATTGYVAGLDILNTSGRTQVIQEGSVAGTTVTGSTAYASLFGSARNSLDLQLFTNATVRMTLNGSTGAATFSSTLQVNGSNSYFGSTKGYIYFTEDQINCYYSSNAAATLAINYYGYNQGLTQFRSFDVYNGKGSRILNLDGSTGAATFSSSVAIGAGLSVSGYGVLSNSANKFLVDFYSGNSRLYSLGTNTTTKGGYEFHTNSSDGSLDVIALGIASTGAATFSSSVSTISTIGSGQGVENAYLGNGFLGYYNAASSPKYIQLSDDASTINAIQFSKSGSSATVSFPSAGNVLIGTTTDAGYKLDVNGTGRFTGSVTASGGASGVGFIMTNTTNSRQVTIGYTSGAAYNYIQAYDGTNFQPLVLNNTLTLASTGAATFSSRVNVNGATDDGSTALNVTGAATFSSSVTAPQAYLSGTIPSGNIAFYMTSTIGTTQPNGMVLYPNYTTAGTGFLTDFTIQATSDNGTRTTTRHTSALINDIIKGTSHTITNDYGLIIGDITQGTNNYSLATGAGKIQLSDLAGSGNRIVVADIYGVLTATTAAPTSGTYTPTITLVSNAASSTARVCQYMRVGSVVTVSGYVTVTATTPGASSRIYMSLPISSSFTSTAQAGGAGGVPGGQLIPTVIFANSTLTTVAMDFIPISGATDYWFSYTYQIL